MKDSLDKESVITAITDGIGAEFGRASRKSYYEQLERLKKVPALGELSSQEQQSLVDLLALAAFYQNVIVPIEAIGSFVAVLKKADAKYLKVSDDRLDQRFAGRVHEVTRGFSLLILRMKIPRNLLTYPTLTQFVDEAKSFYNRRRNGPMDRA